MDIIRLLGFSGREAPHGGLSISASTIICPSYEVNMVTIAWKQLQASVTEVAEINLSAGCYTCSLS